MNQGNVRDVCSEDYCALGFAGPSGLPGKLFG
jgi:hypothetical protein